MRHLGKTPPFRGPHGEVVAGSIAEIAYRRLGRLDQWVMIRGESIANPAMILPALQMPVFFFLGRKDHWVPAEISVAYLNALTAPSKKLVWFEQSGHEPFVDEPA